MDERITAETNVSNIKASAEGSKIGECMASSWMAY